MPAADSEDRREQPRSMRREVSDGMEASPPQEKARDAATAHGAWVSARDRLVWGRDGIASLRATHWLDDTPREFPDTPGVWHADAGRAVGDLPSGRVLLPVGDEHREGQVLLRGFARDGMTALRVFDPAAATDRGISRIDRFPFTPGDTIAATVRLADHTRSTQAVDGHVGTSVYGAEVELDIDGVRLCLAAQVRADGTLFLAFSDRTSGTESYRFRFLQLPAPDADGRVEVDFHRAYLPPCAFSDHYVCVFPPPQNRVSVAIRAGEALVR